MSNQKIAITAASGRLGTAIITELKKGIPSEQIVGLARTPEKAKSLGIEIRKADYNHKQEFVDALYDIDTLLIVSGVDDPQTRIQQNRNVIAAAQQTGVKKLVYTSVIGPHEGNTFSPVVASNRQTEEDIKNSGLQWAIGRNGVYLEADLEYVDTYKNDGGIINSAGDGKCGYTSREELARAYARILINPDLDGQTYNLIGEPITQSQLATAINQAFDTDLVYKSISVAEYSERCISALGERIGKVISGIYEGIRSGEYEGPSDFEQVTGRPHQSVDEMIQDFLNFK